MGDSKRSFLRELRLQVPFLLWLIALWMLLWGQFTLLAFVTGLIVALFVTRVFRLPTVDIAARVNLWYLFLYIVRFLGSMVWGAVEVLIQVWDFRRQPGAAIIAIPLKYADDILMTHVFVTSSLIPGSLVVEADRDRRILYLHVIGVRSQRDVDYQRETVLRWEKTLVRALGNKAQFQALREDERKARG